MKIKKKLCNNYSSREGYKPEIIVIHISGGTDKSMENWFHTPGSEASAHYGVDLQTGDIYQYVEEENKAWHAGRVNNPTFRLYKPGINPNLYTIGIENEGYDLKNASQTQLNALYELIIDICTRYAISIDRDHIIGHYQIDSINRYYCPSTDHTVVDKIVNAIKAKIEEPVCLKVPKSKVEIINNFLKSLWT